MKRKHLLGGCGVISILTTVAMTVAVTAPANAASSSPDDLRNQIASVQQTQAAHQVEAGLATMIVDPALGSLANELLQNEADQLTGFQKAYLKAIQTAVQYGPALSARLQGQDLTKEQQQQLRQLTADLHNNPAIQKMISTGAQLKDDPSLPGDVSSVLSSNNAPSPGPLPGTFGHPNLEAVGADFAAVRSSAAFLSLSSSLSPLVQDPNYVSVLRGSHPTVLVSYLPVADFQALLLPNDRDPSVLDWVKDALEITGGIAAIVAAILLAPEVLTTTVIVGLGAALFAGVAATGVGVIDLINDIEKAEDCDNDGDPGDPDEAGEC